VTDDQAEAADLPRTPAQVDELGGAQLDFGLDALRAVYLRQGMRPRRESRPGIVGLPPTHTADWRAGDASGAVCVPEAARAELLREALLSGDAVPRDGVRSHPAGRPR